MHAEPPLRGRTALVTGASRGLGAEVARRLFAGGASLVLAARDVDALEAVAGGLRGSGAGGQVVATHGVDLADRGQVEGLIGRCLSAGPVHVVVNNAAAQGPIGAFEAVDFDAWRAVFEPNFFAAARVCQGLVGPMRRAGWGKIVNLSGGGAAAPRPDVSAYAAAKCALVRFSETLAVELQGSGVDVNCVAPGAMNTRMLDEVLAAGPAGARREYENARRQQQTGGTPPAKAADLVAFLSSPASDGITGRLLSAVWDPWLGLADKKEELSKTDVYTLRRIVPEDRGRRWEEKKETPDAEKMRTKPEVER